MNVTKFFDALYTLVLQLKIAFVIIGVLVLLGAVIVHQPYQYTNESGACIYVEPQLRAPAKESDCR